MKESILIIFLYITLTSCSSFKEAGKVLRNEKVKTTDEFLVKKREPLVLPPNFKDLPEPGQTVNDEKKNQEKKIKKILQGPKEENIQNDSASTVEESILNQIRK